MHHPTLFIKNNFPTKTRGYVIKPRHILFFLSLLQLQIFLQQLFHQVIGILGKIQGIVYLHREGIVR